jgi:hypothetical protein
MGKVFLLAIPKVEPAPAWSPTEVDIKRYGRDLAAQFQSSSEFSRRSDSRIREQVAVLVSVLGMKDLVNLCVECALAEIIKLCERPDVNAVLDAHQRSRLAAKRKR